MLRLKWALLLAFFSAWSGDKEPSPPPAAAPADSPEVVYYGVTPEGQGQVFYVNFATGTGLEYSPVESDNICKIHRDSRGARVGLRRVLFAKQHPRAPCEPYRGRYVGVSEDDPESLVWFLRLSPNASALYDRTRWLKICEVTRGPGYDVSFRSEEEYGRHYVYRGSIIGDTLRGSLYLESSSRPRNYGRVTFRPVDESGAVYSTMNYVAEAGDMTGAVLIRATSGGADKISLVLIEDAFGPFLAHDVRRSHDTLHLRFAVYPSPWRAVFQDSAVALWDEAAVPQSDGGPTYRLPRTQSLDEFFSEKMDGGCGGPR